MAAIVCRDEGIWEVCVHVVTTVDQADEENGRAWAAKSTLRCLLGGAGGGGGGRRGRRGGGGEIGYSQPRTSGT